MASNVHSLPYNLCGKYPARLQKAALQLPCDLFLLVLAHVVREGGAPARQQGGCATSFHGGYEGGR